MTPPSFSEKAEATPAASCPVMASITRRISWGETADFTCCSSCMRAASAWERPAVSTMTVGG